MNIAIFGMTKYDGIVIMKFCEKFLQVCNSIA